MDLPPTHQRCGYLADAQLDFIYQQTPYYEKTHNRYPVFRVERNR